MVTKILRSLEHIERTLDVSVKILFRSERPASLKSSTKVNNNLLPIHSGIHVGRTSEVTFYNFSSYSFHFLYLPVPWPNQPCDSMSTAQKVLGYICAHSTCNTCYEYFEHK